jgi:hypothetical protein
VCYLMWISVCYLRRAQRHTCTGRNKPSDNSCSTNSEHSASVETAANPNHDDQQVSPPLSISIARRIAHAFGFTVADVQMDAQQVVRWDDPADELLVWMEQRYHWKARSAFVYLRSLRSALRSGQPEQR